MHIDLEKGGEENELVEKEDVEKEDAEEKDGEEKKNDEQEGERVIANPALMADTEPVALTALSLNGTPTTSPADSPRSEGRAGDVYDSGAEDTEARGP